MSRRILGRVTTRVGDDAPNPKRLAAMVMIALALLTPAAATAQSDPGYGIAIVSTSTEPGLERAHVTFGNGPMTAPPSMPTNGTVPSDLPRGTEDLPIHGKLGDRTVFSLESRETRPGTVVSLGVHATLAAMSEHADIWIDDAIRSTVDDRVLAQIRTAAENAYAIVRLHFGTISYRWADVRKHPFVPACEFSRRTDRVSAFVASRGEMMTLLFVDPQDINVSYTDIDTYHSQREMNCIGYASNERPGLIVIPLQHRFVTDSTGIELLPIVVHELQHVHDYVQHQILSDESHVQSRSINEGLSVLSQDLAIARVFPGYRDTSHAGESAQIYLARPNAYGILTFELSAQPGIAANERGLYGGAYLFQRFLYDTFGEPYLRRIASSEDVGIPSIEHATGSNIGHLLKDFGLRLLAPSTAGPDALCGAHRDASGEIHPFHGVILTPIAGDSVEIVRGSVTFVSSDRPIAAIDVHGRPVDFVQVRYDPSSADSEDTCRRETIGHAP
jgi:hypothetical protein